MPAPIYRHASRKGGVIVLLLFVGIAGQFGIFILASAMHWAKPLGGWLLPLSCLPMLLPIVWGGMIYKRAERERVGKLRERLIRHGFDLQSGEDVAPKQAFSVPLKPLFPYIGHLGLLGTDNQPPEAGIEWFAVRSGPVLTFLFEHEFRTGSGKTAIYTLQTILAWPADHPDIRDRELAKGRWCILSRFSKILVNAAAKGGGAEAAFTALEAKGRINHDAATAKRFLTPGVIAELQKAPMPETWYIGAGWILCVFAAPLDGDNIDPFLNHARAVAGVTG